MPRERESDKQIPAGVAYLRDAFRRVRPRRTGFRNWVLENYRLVYFLDLVLAFASLMFYLVSLVTFGEANLVTRVLLGVLIGSAVVAALPLAARRYLGNEQAFRTMLKVRRSRETERVEIIVAVVLWLLIAMAFAFAFLHSRGPAR